MTLEEFDKLRPYLKDGVEVELVVKDDKASSSAMFIEEWGNHDGRFNIACHCCDYRSKVIFPGAKSAMIEAIRTMACPKCGATRCGATPNATEEGNTKMLHYWEHRGT